MTYLKNHSNLYPFKLFDLSFLKKKFRILNLSNDNHLSNDKYIMIIMMIIMMIIN